MTYIDSPNKLLDQIWRDPQVHIVEKKNKLGQTPFTLFDISLKSFGQHEDQQYINSRFYRDNIRRGNTLIQYKNKEIQWCRKGTPKILDIQLAYIQSYCENRKITQKEKQSRDIIFNDVINSLKKGNRVQLIKTEKANGENAQVSYNYEVDAWVICSKNVSLLALYVEELKRYPEQRYQYAKLIGEEWFRMIDQLKKDQVLRLKEKLMNYTMVGQYCGNKQYQHLIQYQKICLKWFALIKNDSNNYCVDPFQFKRQFEEFNFEFVKMKVIGTFLNFQKFINCLEEIHKKTSYAGIDDKQYGMEGSIAYFLELAIKDKKPISTVLGAGKLKTLEYRFLRKIREKITKFNDQKQGQKFIIRKYQDQCIQLQKDCQCRAPYPLDHYNKILQSGILMLKINSLSNEYIRGHFVHLLKLIYYMNFKKINIEKYGKSLIQNSILMNKVSGLSLTQFGAINCHTKLIYLVHGLPGMKKISALISSHYEKLSISYKNIEVNQKQIVLGQTSKIVTDLNAQIGKKNDKELNVYFLQGAFDKIFIDTIVEQIIHQGNRKIHHQIVVITDHVINPFHQHQNQYPFNLQTIIMCYYQTHQNKIKVPKVCQKVQNLRSVTEALRKNVNMSEFKQGLITYGFPFGNKLKITKSKEFQKIILQILQSDNEKCYHKLILRLQEMEAQQNLSQQQISNQIEKLIKSSFPTIPTYECK